jgi:hypothetical protein
MDDAWLQLIILIVTSRNTSWVPDVGTWLMEVWETMTVSSVMPSN